MLEPVFVAIPVCDLPRFNGASGWFHKGCHRRSRPQAGKKKQMLDPDEQDALRRRPLEGDDNAPALTSYQVRRCATIIDAYLDGHEGWREHVETVVQFLHAAATEGGSEGRIIMSQPTAKLWPIIDDLPWPPSGRPKSQQDTGQ